MHETEKKLWEDKVSARQDYLKAEQEWQRSRHRRARTRARSWWRWARPARARGPFNRLEIRALFDGLIVDKHIAVGEAVGAETKVFTVSDLRQVWAEVVVPAKDLEIVRVGYRSRAALGRLDAAVKGKVSFVSAMIGEQSRARARVVLENPQLAWRPGLFVDVDVVTGFGRSAGRGGEGSAAGAERYPGGIPARARTASRRCRSRSAVPTASWWKSPPACARTPSYAAAHSFTIKAEQGKGTAAHED